MRSLVVVLTRWFRLSLLLAVPCLTLNLLLVTARVKIVTWTLFSLVEILTFSLSPVAFFHLFLEDLPCCLVCGWRLLVGFLLDTLLLLCLNSDGGMLYKSTSIISSILSLYSILSALYSSLSFLPLHTLGFFMIGSVARDIFCGDMPACVRVCVEGRSGRYGWLRGLAREILIGHRIWHEGPVRRRRK
jgi:hypothetical protein